MRYSTLFICMFVAGLSAFSITAFANDQTPHVQLEAMVIDVSADASQAGLARSYAGGQVASGSRVGILGNKHYMDTPFSTTAYTQQFIKNTQADGVGDVLKKDPTVTVARGFGNFQEAYVMRGFVTYSDDTMYNGLYGILPRQYTSSELFERVEIQRGASTALNGISPGGANTGGTITLLPKRATSQPLREVSVGYEGDGRAKVSADVGQRFLDNKLGVRTNLSYTKGDGAIKNEEKEVSLISVGADYRGDKFRLSADVGYQDLTDTAKRSSVDVNAVTATPTAPNGKTNWSQTWANTQSKDVFGTVRGEYDITDNLTAYGAYGVRQGKESNVLGGGFFYVTDGNTGDGYYTLTKNKRQDDIHTGEVGLKGFFETGNITHRWGMVANTYQAKEKNHFIADYPSSWNNFAGANNSNLHNPTFADMPSWSASKWATPTGSLDNPALTAKTTLNSVALVNTLGVLDDNLQLTLGGRYQEIDSQDVTWNTFYKDKTLSPVAGINYRFGNWSAFGNYSEKLTAGKQVSINQNHLMLKPYVSKQSEIGVKYDDGNLGASLTAFQIKEPRASLANGSATTKGDNVHQGLEVFVFGRPTDNLRLMTGVALLDAKQKNTDDAFDGKQVIGTAKIRSNIGMEYDVNALEGLTLTGDLSYTGSRYAKADNSLKVPDYALLNLGARYATSVGATPVTLRVGVDNVTDKKHWASVGGYPGQGYLVAGDPRTVKASVSFKF
ncbi:MAG: TonB-dependent receptor [Moraxella sp.]|uniref:TonB-dependent receptor n=1 Tax=Moraxella sp. TaxID=479 RepID=UPI0026DC9C2D|nr:TonB-dependent receptor [Moraxella sp.]MDO4450230.1 TonB-dependent receptor [Moraxella sp.]